MKSTPLLYTAPMVRASLDGTKTQTRRVIKPQPYIDPQNNFCWNGWNFGQDFSGPHTQAIASKIPSSRTKQVLCPYGNIGDQLRVRETFYAYGRWETRFNAKKGRDEWHFVDMTLECGFAYSYAATDSNPVPMRGKRNAGVTPGWWKRPAIFMPRAASRITLEIVSVRVERLQDISEADCIAEGIESEPGTAHWKNYENGPGWRYWESPKQSYRTLWESINGPGSWDLNPWVWVIEFKRVAP